MRYVEVHRRHECRCRCFVEPRLARCDWRSLDRCGRGLRGGRECHSGADTRLCPEVVALAVGPASRIAQDRRDGREEFRVVRGLEHAGHHGIAHSRLSRLRQFRDQGQRGCSAFDAREIRGARAVRLLPSGPPAGDLPSGEGQDRPALACGTAVHRGPRVERVHGADDGRDRDYHARRALQRVERLSGGCGALGRLRQPRGADDGAQRDPPVGARADHRLCQGQASYPDRRGRLAGIHRTGRGQDPAAGGFADGGAWQGHVARGR